MSTTAPVRPAPAAPPFTPTQVQTCDRCVARAKVQAWFHTGPLYFCGHHYGIHQGAIAAHALAITDHREQSPTSA